MGWHWVRWFGQRTQKCHFCSSLPLRLRVSCLVVASTDLEFRLWECLPSLFRGGGGRRKRSPAMVSSDLATLRGGKETLRAVFDDTRSDREREGERESGLSPHLPVSPDACSRYQISDLKEDPGIAASKKCNLLAEIHGWMRWSSSPVAPRLGPKSSVLHQLDLPGRTPSFDLLQVPYIAYRNPQLVDKPSTPTAGPSPPFAPSPVAVNNFIFNPKQKKSTNFYPHL